MKPTILMLAMLCTLTATTQAKQIPANNGSYSITLGKLADVFGAFHAHRQGDFASLNWNVVSDEVASFRIERSYDGEFFTTVDEVSPSDSRWNRYTDNSVEPGIIYYRVIAIMNDGTEESSSTEVVKIVKHK